MNPEIEKRIHTLLAAHAEVFDAVNDNRKQMEAAVVAQSQAALAQNLLLQGQGHLIELAIAANNAAIAVLRAYEEWPPSPPPPS